MTDKLMDCQLKLKPHIFSKPSLIKHVLLLLYSILHFMWCPGEKEHVQSILPGCLRTEKKEVEKYENQTMNNQELSAYRIMTDTAPCKSS